MTTFTDDFYLKIKKWYLYHLEYHYPHPKHKKGRNYYKDLETFLDARSLTAADEVERYSKDSHYRYDHEVMDNASNAQMEIRRCINERDQIIDDYWWRWNRWVKYEYEWLTKFNDIVISQHAFIKGTSKGIRKTLSGGGISSPERTYDYMKIDPIKTVDPDNGLA